MVPLIHPTHVYPQVYALLMETSTPGKAGAPLEWEEEDSYLAYSMVTPIRLAAGKYSSKRRRREKVGYGELRCTRQHVTPASLAKASQNLSCEHWDVQVQRQNLPAFMCSFPVTFPAFLSPFLPQLFLHCYLEMQGTCVRVCS